MARWFSSPGRKRGQRNNTLYLVAAVAVFAIVVFLMFRGDSSTPQEAGAGEVTSQADPTSEPARSTARLAAVDTSEAPVAASRTAPAQADAETPESTPSEPQKQDLVSQDVVRPEPVLTDLAMPAAPPADEKVAAVVAEAMSLLNSHPRQVIAARNKLNEALSLPMPPNQRLTVKEELAKLSKEWLFGPAAFAGDALCESYTVQPGDLLEVIGRRNKVPYEILMQINNISRPQSLQAGKTIKVIKGPFHAKVYRSTFTLELYLQDMYVRSFKVGLGRPGYETPTGLWRVQEGGKLIAPTWTDPDTQRVYKSTDPDYPLGSRWIALDGIEGEAKGRTGFAIHGTKEPEQIGTAGSRGCIRMFNGEAVLVYNMLFPLYSKIEVLD
ncbi:MAG TPA: L,D-transpeptidase family protein [Sedimentisphaerales bacterium]|nr:L,D-transpeptidase family protein [Sedimentisphaerales bacterium]HRS10687.1 L,D-transpeptidase family protein [Sedimentisphaerales bacterium]HRV47392.1 L,D-transpeptidase family protein [Sedimentisphaerales bacterium]